jgi:Cft2 family RNA processing exonuclease
VIKFVDIGQGNCVMIDCGADHSVVVDCGSSQRSQRPGTIIPKEEVASHFRPTKNLLIVITHPDKDHLSLLPLIVTGTSADIEKITLVLGGPFEDYLFSGHLTKER